MMKIGRRNETDENRAADLECASCYSSVTFVRILWKMPISAGLKPSRPSQTESESVRPSGDRCIR